MFQLARTPIQILHFFSPVISSFSTITFYFLSFNMDWSTTRGCFLGRDEWEEITKFLDGRTIARLSCTSKWFHSELSAPHIWRFAFHKEFDVPGHSGEVQTHWKAIYASALRRTNTVAQHPGNRHILHPIACTRIGAILLESTIAMIGKCTFENDNVFVHVKDVKKGIWILDLTVLDDPMEYLEGSYYRFLEARHAEVLLPDPDETQWSWEVIGLHHSHKLRFESVLSIYDRQLFTHSKVKDSSMDDGYNVTPRRQRMKKSLVWREMFEETFLSLLARKAGEGEVIGLRVMERVSRIQGSWF